ncbi:hypothetical protein [Spirillospora sp. NPDC047279]|uniref:hypothetical protein n=1 Tax=Spirillospora sp. NPDC047279 TaxID=3155478 RepID=UPI0033CD8867
MTEQTREFFDFLMTPPLQDHGPLDVAAQRILDAALAEAAVSGGDGRHNRPLTAARCPAGGHGGRLMRSVHEDTRT